MQRKQIQKQTKSEAFTQTLKSSIQEGIYPYGTALPAERELAEHFGLNRSTVRAAIFLQDFIYRSHTSRLQALPPAAGG